MARRSKRSLPTTRSVPLSHNDHTVSTKFEPESEDGGKSTSRTDVSGDTMIDLGSRRLGIDVGSKRPTHGADSVILHKASSDDDLIEEYTFTSEDEAMAEDDDIDDAHSHISVSSQDFRPVAEDYGIEDRPWRFMRLEHRIQYEIMFSRVTHPAVAESWTYTEEYQFQVDALMTKYINDYPLPTWAIGQRAAETAYAQLLERSRWRSLGIKVYGSERLPEIVQGALSQQVLNKTPAPNASSRAYSRTLPSQPPQSPILPTPNEGHQHARTPVLKHRPSPLQTHAPHASSYAQPTSADTRLPRPADPSAVDPSQARTSQRIVPGGFHREQSRDSQRIVPGEFHREQPRTSQLRVPGNFKTEPVNYHPSQLPHLPPPYRPTSLPHSSASDTINVSRPKPKKETPSATPPPPPQTPPYPMRKKPSEREINRSGRRHSRRQAEAEIFPWTRDLDFKKLKAEATWDDSCYDEETFRHMEEIRRHNEPIIDRLDQEVADKQRLARNAKKRTSEEASSENTAKKGRKKKDPGDKGDTSDPYHSGNFAFATAEDERLAMEVGYSSPDNLIYAGETGAISLEVLAKIKITWNPGKKGTTQDLVQAPFTAKDTVLTKRQLANTPILTRRAAECIIDFCPDMLWRDMLLRICSEAGCGNKDVRDRFCLNGCHADKATFTKRISAALGQKQMQPKAKGYGPGDWAFYESNGFDFRNYIEFFGTRVTHRHSKIGSKKRGSSALADDDGTTSGKGTSVGNAETPRTFSSDAQDDDVDMVDVADEDELDDQDSDAVSAQDSDDLDDLSD